MPVIETPELNMEFPKYRARSEMLQKFHSGMIKEMSNISYQLRFSYRVMAGPELCLRHNVSF